MLIVPLMRGSSMKFFRVISLTAFTTPSISALTKLSVTRSGLAGGLALLARRESASGRTLGVAPISSTVTVAGGFAGQVWVGKPAIAIHRKNAHSERCRMILPL